MNSNKLISLYSFRPLPGLFFVSSPRFSSCRAGDSLDFAVGSGRSLEAENRDERFHEMIALSWCARHMPGNVVFALSHRPCPWTPHVFSQIQGREWRGPRT